MTKNKPKKLAVLLSHPIEYKVPLLKKITKETNIDLTAYFCWDYGVENRYDKQFGRNVKIDIPLLEGYKYKFLNNWSPFETNSFWGRVNPGILLELWKKDFDVIWIHGWNLFTNIIIFLFARLFDVSIFLSSETPLNQELIKSRWKIKIKKILLGKILFPKVSSFLYIGEQNKKFYEYYGVSQDKLFFVPYAVDNNRFKNSFKKLAPKKEELKKDLNIEPGDAVVLFVGKLIKKKRPFDLLKAFENIYSIDNSKNKSHLIFVGDGELKNSLEEYVLVNSIPNVHFEGFQNQLKLPKYYTISDIFVLPSGLGETWGLVINEAMNFGLSILVSNIPGSGFDLIKEGINGYIFNVGNVKEMTDKLEALINNKQKLNKFGQKSLKIISKYSYEEDIKGIKIAFQKIYEK